MRFQPVENISQLKALRRAPKWLATFSLAEVSGFERVEKEATAGLGGLGGEVGRLVLLCIYP